MTEVLKGIDKGIETVGSKTNVVVKHPLTLTLAPPSEQGKKHL